MPALKYWNGSAWATISSVAGPAGPPGADSTVPGPIGPSSSVHEEFKPANLATTVTLSQVPLAILVVARDGVVQSATDGNYTLAGSVLTFTDAFNGTERVVVDYSSTSYTPALPINGTTGISDQTVTNVKLASDTARANLLTNGGFEIWQRGNGPFTTNGAFTADRWHIISPGSFSVSKDTTNVDSSSASAAACTCTGSGHTLIQRLEESAQLRGRTVTFSIRVRTATANAVRLIIGDSVAATYSAFHPGGGTYQMLTVTQVISVSAGVIQMNVSFEASCTAYIDNAMLVVGSVAADYAPLHPADDLARCQRYYEVIGGQANGYPSILGYGIVGATVGAPIGWKVTKAVTPTTTKTGTWTVASCSQPTADRNTAQGFRLHTGVTVAGNFETFPADGTCAITGEANP